MLRKAALTVIQPVRKALQGERIFFKGSSRNTAPGARNDAVTVKTVTGKPNPDWPRTRRGTVLTVIKNPVITPTSKIFAIGSCFAMEIRAALRRHGIEVLPRYFDLAFDPARQSVAGLPKQDDLAYYDTFTILREFEMAFGGGSTGKDDFWEVTSPAIRLSVNLSGKSLFQDPHRKRTYANSPEDLADASAKLDACTRQGILEADVYIITLGLIEVWRNRKTGRYLCMAPGRDQLKDAEFILSDFQANLDNMRRICALVRDNAPDRKIIVTVSPVPLGRTFTGKDIIVANLESKSLLRTVAGQIAREFDNVIYWPSYEIAMREDMYEEDGRHVTRAGVEKIINGFMEVHCKNRQDLPCLTPDEGDAHAERCTH